MSRYDWEHGTFILPAAAVAPVKSALRDLVNALHVEVREAAVALHRRVGTSSRPRYAAALDNERMRLSGLPEGQRARLVSGLAVAVLERMAYQTMQDGKALRQPQVSDVACVVPRLTNRDNRFPILDKDGYEEGEIVFDGRTVTYSVPENNHATDRANGSIVTRTFFRHLDRIAWTRGTGGHTMGNDEYNENASGFGREPDYLVRAYGPAGQQRQIEQYRRQGFSRAEAERLVTERRYAQ